MASAIRFKSKHPTHAWLSNFSEDGFEIDGTRWESVEHYYQAQKYSGTEAFNRIREARTPLKARKAGQDRSLTPRDDWDDVKLEVMRDALLAKFTQNPRLRRMLLETGDRELIHESKSDQFWGCSDDGGGQNQLGQLLMQIRTELA
jgi:ribA/ribD-fused uncharacterized protein